MTARLLVVLCGLITQLAEHPVGGGCLQLLPVDGTWAQYHVDIQIANQGINATWLVRSVGEQMHDGKPCRWIELEQFSNNPQLGKLTWRCLVPEEEFGKGKHPIGQAVKVWHAMNGQNAEAVDSILAKDGFFGALIQGPEKELKNEDAPEVVKWQGGELECQVVTGESEAKFNTLVVPVHHRIFRHPDAPFGLGGLHWEVTLGAGNLRQTITVKMTLQDQGTDAKAQYPHLGT